MRSALTAIAAACVLTASVIAQQQGRVGVLIGIRTDTHASSNLNAPASTYRTYFIVREGGVVRLAGDAENLLVPRPDGFWRIGSRLVRWDEEYAAEYVWASTALGRPLTLQEDVDEGCAGYSFSRVDFVLGNYLAATSGSKLTCGGRIDARQKSGLVQLASLRDRQASLTEFVSVKKAPRAPRSNTFRAARGNLVVTAAPREIAAADLRVPLPDGDNHAVMVEWATAANVSRWNTAMKMLAREPAPRTR